MYIIQGTYLIYKVHKETYINLYKLDELKYTQLVKYTLRSYISHTLI